MLDNKVIIKQIKNSSDTIFDIWNEIKYEGTNHICDVWEDKVCRIFIDKLMEANYKVNEIIILLEELQLAWQKYLKTIETNEEFLLKKNN